MCKAAYIHVPFCQDICAYCDFFRCRYHAGLADKWLHRLCLEIKEKQLAELDTIYIGGGTPSALSCVQLECLLQAIQPYRTHCKEFTIEANVESCSDEKLALCKAYGVNRISLGVQTLQPDLLKCIHRHHTKQDVMDRIQSIHQAGIHNISIDLIYGLPNQTMTMWKEDLAEIVHHFPIQHISLYALTIEEHSEFGRMEITSMDEDMEADMYEYAIAYLQEHGFRQYEISNFTKPGFASKHNLSYWRYDDFYGIGCGASGKQNHRRYTNTCNLETYITQGAAPDVIALDIEDEMFEMVMMSLRLKEGLSFPHFYDTFHRHIEDVYGALIHSYQEKGMLEIKGDYLRATQKGYPLLHEILISFLPETKE